MSNIFSVYREMEDLPRDIGGQKSLSYKSSELRYGNIHALVFQDKFFPDNSLELSIRVVGAKPSIRRLHCYIKHVWNIDAKFIVKEFKDTTFSVAFSTISDFLRVADRT